MAYQKQDGLHTDSALSAADLRGMENRFVSFGADGRINLTAAGARVDGVLSEGKPEGYHSSFNTDGNPMLRVEAGAALARNARVVSDAQGRAVTAGAGAEYVFGIVREPVGAAGEVATIIPQRGDTPA